MDQRTLQHAVDSSLISMLDQAVLVCTQDGRVFTGVLRSFDQFSNVVMERVAERLVCKGKFADKPVGDRLIRGESIVVLGPYAMKLMTRVPISEVEKLRAEQMAATKKTLSHAIEAE